LAAASLKRRRRRGRRRRPGAFPRPIGRGLIEAMASVTTPRTSRSNFRGQLAAASLKRCGCPRPRSRRSDFRGQLAAASLKRHTRLARALRTRTFPRPIGRGLIEAWNCSLAFLHVDNFRGQLAAASLKRINPTGWVKVLSAFPRPIGRGLIEARSASATWNRMILISAANWPRPH